MSAYVIVTDSTTDLPLSYVKEKNLPVIFLSYQLGNDVKPDDFGASMEYGVFYNRMRSGEMPSTSQINVSQYIDFFTSLLKEGKDIVYIAFSSGLSGSCNSAKMAADELKEQFPERRIAVVDSLCASMGEGLLVYTAVSQMEKGMGYDEMVAWLEANRQKLSHWFTVDDLNHLHRGGRVSKTSAVLGTLLGIKPVLNVDENGKLIPRDKIRGRRQSLDTLCARLMKYAVNLKEQTIFISHGDCIDDAKYLAEQIRQKTSVKDILINYIGPVIGAHSGPGTVALFFFSESRAL